MYAYAQTSGTLDATMLINDLTSPVITGVPSHVTVLCSNIPDEPTNVMVTDNFDPNPVMSYSQVQFDGTSYASGYTLNRTWMATDACKNTTTGSQIITIHDAPSASPSAVLTSPTTAAPTDARTTPAPTPAVTDLPITNCCSNKKITVTKPCISDRLLGTYYMSRA